MSESEVNEIKDRINVAICATKAAISEGMIQRVECALRYASKYLMI